LGYRFQRIKDIPNDFKRICEADGSPDKERIVILMEIIRTSPDGLVGISTLRGKICYSPVLLARSTPPGLGSSNMHISRIIVRGSRDRAVVAAGARVTAGRYVASTAVVAIHCGRTQAASGKNGQDRTVAPNLNPSTRYMSRLALPGLVGYATCVEVLGLGLIPVSSFLIPPDRKTLAGANIYQLSSYLFELHVYDHGFLGCLYNFETIFCFYHGDKLMAMATNCARTVYAEL